LGFSTYRPHTLPAPQSAAMTAPAIDGRFGPAIGVALSRNRKLRVQEQSRIAWNLPILGNQGGKIHESVDERCLSIASPRSGLYVPRRRFATPNGAEFHPVNIHPITAVRQHR
jgi:hypothetical protein